MQGVEAVPFHLCEALGQPGPPACARLLLLQVSQQQGPAKQQLPDACSVLGRLCQTGCQAGVHPRIQQQLEACCILPVQDADLVVLLSPAGLQGQWCTELTLLLLRLRLLWWLEMRRLHSPQ